MNVFDEIGGVKPRFSYFPLDAQITLNCDMGQLIPIYHRYMIPGDVFEVSKDVVARMMPMIAPEFTDIDIYTYDFFCPLRILMGEMVTHTDSQTGELINDEWRVHDHDLERFFTGGQDGKDETVVLPIFVPTGEMVENDNYVSDHVTQDFVYATGKFVSNTEYYHFVNGIQKKGVAGTDYTVGNNIPANTWLVMSDSAPYPNEKVRDNGTYSLWDYLGYPIDVKCQGAEPLDFAKRMYNFVWNEYFRNQNYDSLIDITTSNKVLNCRWKKDYFTSSLPQQQRGIQPALPVQIMGDSFVQYMDSVNVPTGLPNSVALGGTVPNHSDTSTTSTQIGNTGGPYSYAKGGASVGSKSLYVNGRGFDATTFDVTDLRLAFQIQRYFERNMRAGARWKEFLIANYGVAPNDDRLQRPIYIGGTKSPVIVSEVRQTSSSDSVSPQGNLAGYGLSADSQHSGKYRAKEFGIYMTILCIKPRAVYSQGIDREELYRTRFDFYNSAFAHLSEQAVYTAEIFAKDTDNLDNQGNPHIFGYQGIFNELRSSHNRVLGGMRNALDYWHLARKFDDLPALNSDFVKCNPTKRIFSVYSEPGFVLNVGVHVNAYRPIPIEPVPGLIDHA